MEKISNRRRYISLETIWVNANHKQHSITYTFHLLPLLIHSKLLARINN